MLTGPFSSLSSHHLPTFEDLIHNLLQKLSTEHPTLVAFRRHPQLVLHNGQLIIPDFELVYQLPFQTDHRLIECQDRVRSSQDVLHKIRSVRTLGPRNRFIFLYRWRKAISDALREALDADGVVHYDAAEFAAFLEALSDSLEHRPDQEPVPGRYLDEIRRWEGREQEEVSRYIKEMLSKKKWHKDEGMLGRA